MHAILSAPSRRHRFTALIVASVCFVLAACGAPASSSGPPQQRNATPLSLGESAKVNIDEIFPPGRGRDLVLNNCTSCHTFVPIVVLQMDKEQWTRSSREHRERVDGLSDEDFKILYDYLIPNFNPNKPVPKLPKELLDTWTSY